MLRPLRVPREAFWSIRTFESSNVRVLNATIRARNCSCSRRSFALAFTLVSTRRDILALAAPAAAFLLTACHRKQVSARAPAPVPSSAPVLTTETGVASWYGHPYHGRPAADGEIYDMEKMTAAHRTLPFNTWVRVTNLNNGRTADVRIIDRGPFVDGRIIDVSHAAARELGLIGPGLANVRIDVISAPAAAFATPSLYAVQVSAFTDRTRAEQLMTAMSARYGAASVVLRQGNPPTWRVLVGREVTITNASALAAKLSSELSNCFVVRLDDDSGAAIGADGSSASVR